MDWFEETLHPGFHSRLGINRVLHETKTNHQHLIIFDNEEFGRVLALDGVVQTTEQDEFIYHEMLAHAPILAHGRARNVLIVGGGDGGMLEEVLKHDSVETAVQVEIDDTVVELAKQHLRMICGNAYDDPRTELVIADGVEYVNETDRRFDIIIVDSTDPIAPAKSYSDSASMADANNALPTAASSSPRTVSPSSKARNSAIPCRFSRACSQKLPAIALACPPILAAT